VIFGISKNAYIKYVFSYYAACKQGNARFEGSKSICDHTSKIGAKRQTEVFIVPVNEPKATVKDACAEVCEFLHIILKFTHGNAI